MPSPFSSAAPEPTPGAGPGSSASAASQPRDGRPSLSGHVLLAWRREQLRLGGSRDELDWLLDLCGGLSWNALQRLLLSPDQPVKLAASLEEMAGLWERRLHTGEPLQYLVGRCPWRDLELTVGPGVLIPRQETELLVELAQVQIAGRAEKQGRHPAQEPRLWADLGTGSGCLAAALARLWPSSRGFAVDLSPEALAVAKQNLDRLGVLEQLELLEGSWWDPLRPHWGQLDLVVANPPYIPDGIWHGLDPVVREHEPRLALSSGADGLDALRLIAADAATALAPGGWLLLEHHHDQSPAVLALLERSGLQNPCAHSDLEGKARFASARRSPDG